MTRGAWFLVGVAVLAIAVYLAWHTDAVRRRVYPIQQTWLQVRQGHVGFFIHWSRRRPNDNKPDEPGAGGRQPD